MLARRFYQFDAVELRVTREHAHIGEACSFDYLAITGMLYEEGNVLRQRASGMVVPVIGMNVGQDDCVYVQELLDGNR